MSRNAPQNNRESGAIVVTILALMIFFSVMLLGLVAVAQANLSRARGRIMLLQAQYAAESGADAAIAQLNSGNTTYSGTPSETTLLDSGQYKATYVVSVNAGSDDKERIITATGNVYDPRGSSTPSYTRKIRITAQRSSTEYSSSMLSRNIIYVASGVKEISGRDIYVNNFIDMPKNTTDLIAENITVAGKNTGIENCSIGGAGNLKNPRTLDPSYTFKDPSQTKTKLMLAYNNCITPPGNAGNADFDVLANQTNISTIQSTYIPWDQYMDNSYLNGSNGCSDWLSGSNPVTIPSTGNSKKTHYPDSGSGVAANCGSSGSLNLGSKQYNITDNVHIRANLCSSSMCDPTFFNPTSDVKYVFVEGTVNFEGVKTANGSGPIVMITYGTDPASKTSDCPYGGSVYIGQSGSGHTDAPALYILAMNGLCIDKTKFDSTSADPNTPVFGGIGGKNLYISSSPSTPRPMLLDPDFPIEAIPIDLAWREVYYERL